MKSKRGSIKISYLLYYVLNSPLFSLYSLMAFILNKDLNATILQITTLVALKPTSALLSSYWNDYFSISHGRFKSNLIGATLLGVLPTFFFPYFTNGWVFVIAYGIFFFSERAVIPVWMELIKVSFSENQRSQIVAFGSLIMFVTSAVIPLFICPLLDKYHESWRWIFPILGFISLARLSIILFSFDTGILEGIKRKSSSCSLLSPLKRGFLLLLERPDFAYYQAIFSCGALGLMVMQPCLPIIAQDHLNLSYTEIATAIAFCKGVGFAATNHIFASKLYRTNIFKYCGIVTLFGTGSILLILLSKYFTFSFYLAFILYGVMQAGSQLSWQLGGPIFSPHQDSSQYTSLNVSLVGIRGCIGPLLGGVLAAKLGTTAALSIGSLFCFLGFCFGYLGSKNVAILEQSKV